MGHHSTPAGLLVAAVLASVLSSEAQQRPSFRSGVDVVSLSVTVTGQYNRYITDLTQDDFLVYEDGVQQETTFFTRTQLPISLALLLDTSASMEERLQTAQEAAVGFASRSSRRLPTTSSVSNGPSDRPRPGAPRRCTTPSTSR